ncbi:hypothetical protein GBF38_012177 [Nibea albiflora]|uniref:Uncharacterized protein n=1 Tax=Nibea albiflora TaxID=240163 RepID=A0ACB7EM43_NIBAL|nr:hypothetical protein GBF38_012177 [Nibea albiflora]
MQPVDVVTLQLSCATTPSRAPDGNIAQAPWLFPQQSCRVRIKPQQTPTKIFSDEKGKLEEAELSNALTEIAAEHNSVIQTNATESKA